MEIFDVINALAAGAALGIILGHWLGKADRKLEYDRGFLDGINKVWPDLVASWRREILYRSGHSTGDTPPGGDRSPE